jgi:hypothetical protein
MITKRTEYGMMTILPDGQIQLRQDTVIEEDGVELSRTYHRSVLKPGDDVSTATDARIPVLTAAVWTPDVLSAFTAKSAVPAIPVPDVLK